LTVTPNKSAASWGVKLDINRLYHGKCLAMLIFV
jgi:hypothetical protein